MAEIELNRTTRCTLCADSRRKLGLRPIHQANSRVDLGSGLLCPTHDLAGPVAAYSARVLEAIGHG